MEVNIKARFPWTIREPESPDRRWIAVCDPLNLALEANTFSELRSVINEAVTLLLCDLYVDGELEEFFRQRGWEISSLPPPGTDPKDVQFVLPPVLEVA